MTVSTVPTLYLKKREDRRVRAGHVWVFSNELDLAKQPIKGLDAGTPVVLCDHDERLVGSGYVNPQSLIAVRLMQRKTGFVENPAGLLKDRINDAYAMRQTVYSEPYYRLIHGEADYLPGLVVDRYGDTLVAEITTAGMQLLSADIAKKLLSITGAKALIWRNDVQVRALEGLDLYVEVARGEPGEELDIKEANARFKVPAMGAQKTGWFYDQAQNRARMQPYVAGRSVLDLFSYAGGWGVTAAKLGATEVTCVDSSAKALQWATDNAALNGVSIATECGDAFDIMKAKRQANERFGCIVVDPPALIPRRKDAKAGIAAYQRINEMAMSCVEQGGYLISCSCSYHLDSDMFVQALRKAAIGAGRRLQFLEQGGAGPDHPIHPAMPETQYLKAWFCRVL